MIVSRRWLLTGAMLFACSLGSTSWGALAVPGDYQIANGGANDWNPAEAPLMADMGGDIYTLDLTGLTGAASGDRFQFKILDAGDETPAWGQPEVPDNGAGSQNNWFLTDGSGDASITVDRNTYSDGFLPEKDRMTSSVDIALVPGFYAVGDWMDEAGGAADWDPADPLFQLVDQGGGTWSVDTVISDVGSYQFKVTGGSFDLQWGTNGRLVDAANWAFDTVVPNQAVTFLLNTSGAISLATVPEPSTCILALGGLLAVALGRRRR